MAHDRRTLGDLGVGESAIVESYLDVGRARRCMALGLVPGAVVTVVRRAPLGDPVEYSVKGSRICIRRSDASSILIG